MCLVLGFTFSGCDPIVPSARQAQQASVIQQAFSEELETIVDDDSVSSYWSFDDDHSLEIIVYGVINSDQQQKLIMALGNVLEENAKDDAILEFYEAEVWVESERKKQRGDEIMIERVHVKASRDETDANTEE